VESLFDEMLYEFNKEQKYYEINIKADLLKLLAIISREYERGYINQDNGKTFELFEKYKDAINKTIIYLNENYYEDLSLEDASKMAMLSQAYFIPVSDGVPLFDISAGLPGWIDTPINPDGWVGSGIMLIR